MIEKFKQLIVVLISVVSGVAIFEFGLRLQNSFIAPMYDIEMWRYSKELKIPVENEQLSHVHRKNSSSNLQNVTIRVNNSGARGAEIEPFHNFENNVLFIGSSVVLGWGVDEEDTISSQIKEIANKSAKSIQVVNAGVGNYNAVRYVTNYFENFSVYQWDTIIVGYFVNDAEKLRSNRGNFVTRNLMVGVIAWKFFSSLTTSNVEIEDYYRAVYDPASQGHGEMVTALEKLAHHCKEKRIRCVLAMIPDIHQLNPYSLGFIHDEMKLISNRLGFEYLDMLPALEGVSEERLWNNYGDPHPNGLAHLLMADRLNTYLEND